MTSVSSIKIGTQYINGDIEIVGASLNGQTITVSGGTGTVSSLASADGSITVTNPTTTPDLAVVKAPKWSAARLLAGNSVDGSANVAFANKFIVQGTTDTGLSAAQFLGALGTGIVKNTTTTGVLSIAIASDFPTLNQNTTGSAATLTTPRTIGGNSFDGSVNITVASATAGFTVSGGDLALGANNITMTGSLGATGARLTKGWFTDLQVTNNIAGSITGNAATVTTNANLTGVITSSGNATSIASQTGTGTKFVVDTSPTLVTPALGVATATSLAIGGATIGTNGLAVTGHLLLEGVTSTGATGTGKLVFDTAPQLSTIELGAATDTTIARVSAGVISVEGVTIPTISSTSTITNKRNQPRVVSAASYTTDTGTSLDVSTCDLFIVTAQAGALKFNNPSGTPVQGEKLMLRIKDDGTARALTYDTQFRASPDLAFPTTTVISKTLYLGLEFNSTDTKWDLLAVLNNF